MTCWNGKVGALCLVQTIDMQIKVQGNRVCLNFCTPDLGPIMGHNPVIITGRLSPAEQGQAMRVPGPLNSSPSTFFCFHAIVHRPTAGIALCFNAIVWISPDNQLTRMSIKPTGSAPPQRAIVRLLRNFPIRIFQTARQGGQIPARRPPPDITRRALNLGVGRVPSLLFSGPPTLQGRSARPTDAVDAGAESRASYPLRSSARARRRMTHSRREGATVRSTGAM